MQKNSIKEISVKELVDEVDINRSTFYLHYSDIPGLLAEVENETLIGYKYFKFSGNKNISVWHINNEYGGYCYCDNCQNQFRVWLKDK